MKVPPSKQMANSSVSEVIRGQREDRCFDTERLRCIVNILCQRLRSKLQILIKNSNTLRLLGVTSHQAGKKNYIHLEPKMVMGEHSGGRRYVELHSSASKGLGSLAVLWTS